MILNQHGVTIKREQQESESNFNSFGGRTSKEDTNRVDLIRRIRPQPRLFKPASNELILKSVDLVVEGDKANQVKRKPRQNPMLVLRDRPVKHSVHLRGSSSVKTSLLPDEHEVTLSNNASRSATNLSHVSGPRKASDSSKEVLYSFRQVPQFGALTPHKVTTTSFVNESPIGRNEDL